MTSSVTGVLVEQMALCTQTHRWNALQQTRLEDGCAGQGTPRVLSNHQRSSKENMEQILPQKASVLPTPGFQTSLISELCGT